MTKAIIFCVLVGLLSLAGYFGLKKIKGNKAQSQTIQPTKHYDPNDPGLWL